MQVDLNIFLIKLDNNDVIGVNKQNTDFGRNIALKGEFKKLKF